MFFSKLSRELLSWLFKCCTYAVKMFVQNSFFIWV